MICLFFPSRLSRLRVYLYECVRSSQKLQRDKQYHVPVSSRYYSHLNIVLKLDLCPVPNRVMKFITVVVSTANALCKTPRYVRV